LKTCKCRRVKPERGGAGFTPKRALHGIDLSMGLIPVKPAPEGFARCKTHTCSSSSSFSFLKEIFSSDAQHR